MLSVPSTPAQGATAPTAVEKAERRVDALQQEKDALQNKISLLEKKISLLEKKIKLLKKYCSRRITDSERAEVAKELWDAFEIDVEDVAEAKAELEDLMKNLDDLKKDLTSVNTLYEKTVCSYADLVAMQKAAQVPQKKYMDVELTELLKRRTGTDATYDKPLVGRDAAKQSLKDALAAERKSERWGVITTVGVPGSGKTFFLRAGVLRNKEYMSNSIMMTYNEDADILDDGKMDVKTAFARQLVQANCIQRDEVDFEKIVDFDTVVHAFRLLLNLKPDQALIVCVDELMKLRTKLDKRGMNSDAAHKRCQDLRSGLMSYQDHCTNEKKPEIRFVWTSLTDYFEESLRVTGSKRDLHLVPLSSLNVEDSWKVLDEGLRTRAESDSILRWGFSLCAGNPRALADGLNQYNELRSTCVAETAAKLQLPLQLEMAIQMAFRVNACNTSVVDTHFTAVLAGTLTETEKAKLLTEGYLLQGADREVLCLQPALVRLWATSGNKKTGAQELAAKYFSTDRFVDPKVFEEQTYLFEQLLNHAYAELKQTPEISAYFSGAYIEESLQKFSVHPRPLPRDSVFRPSSLEDEILVVKERLKEGATVYSANMKEEGVDVLIPLRLRKTPAPLSEEKESAAADDDAKADDDMHIFCGQNKLVEDRIDSLTNVEKKVAKAIKELDLGDQAHGLYFTTHSRGLATAHRTGVWFTRESLERWLGRMGMPQCTMKRKAEDTPADTPAAKKLRGATASEDA